MKLWWLGMIAVASATTAWAGIKVAPAAEHEAEQALPVAIGGRAERSGTADRPRFRRQWPGTYFETSMRGTDAAFRLGEGEVALHVSVDGDIAATLVKPRPGLYRIAGMTAGLHRLRVQVVSESQAGPTEFGGFYAIGRTRPAPSRARPRRQIEFIGDSHTVGYGNTSPTRTCSEPEVWATTDTSRGVAALTAGRFGADYQVNAISGRGVVRNYNGFSADTLPAAYPYVLFDKREAARDPAWTPEVIVIALGTNDFTTALNPGERWRDRDALHADFEASYAKFVARLRARNPHAFFVLWATDLADGEIAREVRRAYDRIRAAGEDRIAFVPVSGLAFSACNAHPSLADDARIAEAVARAIDAQPRVWRGR